MYGTGEPHSEQKQVLNLSASGRSNRFACSLPEFHSILSGAVNIKDAKADKMAKGTNLKWWIVVSVVLACVWAGGAAGEITYVDEDANAGGNGTSWAELAWGGAHFALQGRGAGPIDAFVNAIKTRFDVDFRVVDYHQHATGAGADAQSACHSTKYLRSVI